MVIVSITEVKEIEGKNLLQVTGTIDGKTIKVPLDKIEFDTKEKIAIKINELLSVPEEVIIERDDLEGDVEVD